MYLFNFKRFSHYFPIVLLGFMSITTVEAKLNTKLDDIEKTFEVRLKGMNANGAVAKARVMRTQFNLSLKHQLYPTIEGKVEALAKMETGSNSSTVIDQYSPQNRIRVGDSYLKWDPMGLFFVKLGSLDQSRHTPLLVHRNPYTAAQQGIYYKYNKNYEFFFRLQQAIPNNDVLMERLTGIEEGTPTYLTQTAGMKLEGDLLSIRTFAKHFQFKNISSTIANQSRFIGNSISGTGDLNSDFLYSFDGFYYYLDVELKHGLWEAAVWAHYLYNDNAPDERNTGLFWGPIFRYDYFGIGLNIYENQSDSSPAFYANQAYPKNTEGMDYYLEGNFPEDKVKLRFHYIEKELINDSLYQADETYWMVEFRKKYIF